MDHRTAIGFLVLLLSTTWGNAFGQSAAKAERPDVKAGDSWTYEQKDLLTGNALPESTIRVTKVDDERIVAGSAQYTREWNFIQRTQGGRVTLSSTPHAAYYRFPLEVGKKWSATWDNASDRVEASWSAEFEVVALETVTVPAGSFEAFKIKMDASYRSSSRTNTNRWQGGRQETIWYAPKVKRAVKSESDESSSVYAAKQSSELKSFKLSE